MAPGGYAWWYLDALSDDHAHGLTLIAFVGSVFSPYYAAARRRTPGGAADPQQHVAMNVALYGRGGHRWCMTERGAGALARDAHRLRVGPSALAWDGDTLVAQLDEITAPWPSRVRGTLRLHAPVWHADAHVLDRAGRHRWTPIAPCARIEVLLDRPSLRWTGHAYLDSNRGDEPLERGFRDWHWSRCRLADGRALVHYDLRRREMGDGVSGGGTAADTAVDPAADPAVEQAANQAADQRAVGGFAAHGRKGGAAAAHDAAGAAETHSLALRFDAAGRIDTLSSAPPIARLPPTGWRLERRTRCDAGLIPTVIDTLEDGPFYARSLLRSTLDGETATLFHESLSLDRFAARWVQALLPFRMPRRG